MIFYSPDFQDMSKMPVRFTADAEDICPDFMIEDVPEASVSLAIVCHDPDATRGIPWVHWLVWNLPADNHNLDDGIFPNGTITGINSFGNRSYGGPSPSPGTGPHRYIFTLYALSRKPDLEGKTTYHEITSVLDPICIESAAWTGLYERN